MLISARCRRWGPAERVGGDPLLGCAGVSKLVRDETPGEQDARMKWFREARFGMFIHWVSIRSPREANGS